MKFTNRLGLPEAIVRAVSNDPYNPGDCEISVTRLISPPRKVVLEARHTDEIEEDVSNRIWALLGQSVHAILERAAWGDLTEERLSMVRQGWKLSGAFDSFTVKDGELSDYKVTSWFACKDGGKPEWVGQLNILATLLREHGHDVKKLSIVAILKDWRKSDLLKNPRTYPPCPVMKIDIPMWPESDTELYIDKRIREHQAARITLPECSASDRWETATMYAVMKKGGKRATKLCVTEAEAVQLIDGDTDFSIVTRPGTCKRCEDYCNAADFCDQWKAIQAKQQAAPAAKETEQ